MPSPEEFHTARLRVLIARLSPYHETAAGITHSWLFQMARSYPGVFVDFAFLPPAGDESLMRRSGIPLWIGTTSKHPPCDFDLIAVSNSVVQELLNLPALLEGSGIPLGRSLRAQHESPFILLGGSNSLATAILHGQITDDCSEAGLVDALLIGDGEEAFPQIIDILLRHTGRIRESLGELRRSVPGFYDPSGYDQKFDEQGHLMGITAKPDFPLPVRAHRHRPGAVLEGFSGGPIFFDEATAGKSHLQISMGCPYFCSFCKESWEQKPYREMALTGLRRTALKLKQHLGLSELSLMSFNANTYSGIHGLLDELDTLFHRVTLKSQRFDAISVSPGLLERQVDLGKRTFTCAMEGISRRLRLFLQKNLSDQDLLNGFTVLLANHIRQMKVFLIVTGLEKSPDLTEFAGFLSQLNEKIKQGRSRPIITFSLAALFRPPLTPLQFMPRYRDGNECRRLFQEISAIITKAGFAVRISAGPEEALVSEFLSYADRRFTPVLVATSVARGQRYYGSIDVGIHAVLTAEISQRFNKESLATCREGINTVFPWDDIDSGIDRDFLWKTFQNLTAGKETSTCLPPPLGDGVCKACGACISGEEKKRLSTCRLSPPGRRSHPGKEPTPLSFRLFAEVPSRWAWVGNSFLFAALARMLMLGKPEWTERFIRFSYGIDRNGFSGIFPCEFLLKAGDPTFTATNLLAVNSQGNGLSILSLQAAKPTKTPEFPPLSGVFIRPDSQVNRTARDVDEILLRYGLRHQKQWHGDTLSWVLQGGHAKKSGFGRIRWRRDSSSLVMDLHAPVAEHFFNKFSGGGAREFRFPEDKVWND